MRPNVTINLVSAALVATCFAMPSQAQQSESLGWLGSETIKTTFGDFEFKEWLSDSDRSRGTARSVKAQSRN